MAGWIRYCPQDLGWLQPSQVITRQEIPAGGYSQPRTGFLTRWGFESLLTGIYTIAATGMIAFAARKKLRFFLVFPGCIVMAAGMIFHNNGMVSTYTLLVMGIILTASGIVLYRRTAS